MSVVAARRRAEACFRLASHPNTGDGERDAALARGREILARYGLAADDFDIPGRARPAQPQDDLSALISLFGEAFGSCVCGGVASVGAVCRACHLKAVAMVCPHGRHGFCLECEDDRREIGA